MTRYCFIGGGNMAKALIGGLISKGVNNRDIKVIDPDPKARKECESLYEVRTFTNLKSTESDADVTILAVKPNLVQDALTSFNPKDRSLLVSVAAGIKISTLEKVLGQNKAIVRSMPNTPALIGKGATVVRSNTNVNETQEKMVEELFGAVGIVRWIESEDDLDAVTAISGSGPAYFFLFAELIETAAIQLGLEKKLARELSFQTFYGSALLLENSPDSAKTLREKVTSPGGTTEKALASLEKNNLYSLLLEAIMEAKNQAKSLSKQ